MGALCGRCLGAPVGRGLDGAYKLLHCVGRGAEAEVWLAEEQDTGERYALKIIPRAYCQEAWRAQALIREVLCSLELGAQHVHIIQPYELLLTRTHVVLATAYAPGGTLARYCSTHRVDEHTALYFFRQLVAAIRFCHSKKVIFRDIKPENMLLDRAEPPTLRLCDFGVARKFSKRPGSGRTMHTLAGAFAPALHASCVALSTAPGTPGFMSPQVLGIALDPTSGSYDGVKADVWSLGCVLCLMVLHHLPFAFDGFSAALDGPSALRTAWDAELHTRWRSCEREDITTLSRPLLELMDSLLEPDEGKRASLEALTTSPWFCQTLPAHLQAALDAQEAAQADLTAGCDCEELLFGSDGAIQELIRTAGKPDLPDLGAKGILARVELTPAACRRRSVDTPRVTPQQSKRLVVSQTISLENEARLTGVAEALEGVEAKCNGRC